MLHYSFAKRWNRLRTPRRLRKGSIRLSVEALEDRCTPSATWSSYAGNAQHTADSSVASQSLDVIHWQTPVDLNPQFSGNDLLIHYGSPLITAANTVIVPVKTGATGGFEVNGINGADGSLMWTRTTDYILPPHNWTPSFSPVLTPNNRLYFAGAGGTVYYIDSPDSNGATITGQLAFYGIANYNSAQFDNNVFINTPITSDSNGDIYFGFQATNSAPLSLKSGIARIAADGTGSWIAATTAANDSGIVKSVMNDAPALSNDGSKLYVAVSAGNFNRGYLLELDSTSLATLAKTTLMDVAHPANNAALLDDGTASTTVGPDGDVYFGVLESPFPSNNDRGWLLHFSGDLSQAKTSGAFGWDDTASIVPAFMVPSYQGTSSYLLMTKYNNYAGINTGDGQNKIAILDPNASETDPVTGATVMKEVLSILGQTPDADHPGGVREWCINSAVVDPATKSVLANSEDGKLYRWDLTTNSFTQVITLTPGVGEAYTPTIIGVDGTVYAINDATLFAVGAADAPLTAGVLTAPTAVEGAPVPNAVLYHFIDADPNGTVSDYTATVVWGDGTTEDNNANPADVAIVANAGGGFDVVGSHTYLEELTGQTFSVSVLDQGGSSASTSETNFSVADAPSTAGVLIPPTAVEGAPVTNAVLYHFTDADPNGTVNDYTATVVWGDGTTEDNNANPADVAVVANAGGGFDVVGSHTYLEELTGQTFSVSVLDQGGSSASTSETTFSVADAPLTAGVLISPTAVEGAPVPNAVLYHFTDADPNGTVSDYTATVVWGDGTTEDNNANPADVAVVANAGGGFDVVGSHTYLEELTGQTFNVSVLDQGGSSASTSATNFSVADAPLTAGVLIPPTAVEGAPVANAVLYHFIDADPNGTVSDSTATVVWGDGTTEDNNANPADVAVVANAGGGFDVVGSHTYLEELTGQTFSVSVLDQGGSSASTSATNFSVADAPLTAGVLTAPTATEGVPLSNVVLFHFTDADLNGTAADYTATVVWGDGTTEDSTTSPTHVSVVASSGGGFEVVGSHTYLEELTGQIFSISVADHGATPVSAFNNISVNQAAASQLVIQTQPSATATAGQAFAIQPVIYEEDAFGNLETGDSSTQVTASLHSGTGPLQGTTTVTVSGGVATFTNLADNKAETISLDFTSGILSKAASITITVNAAATSKFLVTGFPSPITAGVASAFTMTAQDAFGNATPGYQGTVHFTSSDALASMPADYTFTSGDAGTHSSSATLKATGPQSITATDTSNSAITGSQSAITVTAAVSDDGLFVSATFHDLLARAASTQELSTNLAPIDAARFAPLPSFSNGFVFSTEYFTDVVKAYYQKYLGRAADATALSFWPPALQTGTTDEQLITTLVGSLEYFNKHGGANLSFLQAAYLDILGRPLDSAGQSYWLAQLQAGTPRTTVATTLLSSTEYRRNLVISYYSTYLGRGASSTEIAGAVNALANGLRDEALINIFVSSQEYFKGGTLGGDTNKTWFSSLYQKILNRAPDAAGLNGALNALLNEYAVQRQTEVAGLIHSQEYRTDVVNGLYQKYLGRAADPGALAFWVPALQTGTATDEQLIAALVGSQEYFTKHGGANLPFLQAAYLDILGRALDPAGQAYWLGQLQAGASRTTMATTLLGSLEYRSNVVSSFYTTYLGRSGSSTDIAYWAGQLGLGVPDEQVIDFLLTSNEYFLKVHTYP